MWTLIVPLILSWSAERDWQGDQRMTYEREFHTQAECETELRRLNEQTFPFASPHVVQPGYDLSDQPPGVDPRWGYAGLGQSPIGACLQIQPRPVA